MRPMARGLFEGWHIVVLLYVVATLALWLWALVDAASQPRQRWEATGHSKPLFIVLIVFLGWVGALLYAFIPRPALVRARTA